VQVSTLFELAQCYKLLIALRGAKGLSQSRLICTFRLMHLAHMVLQVHLVMSHLACQVHLMHLVIWRRFKSRWRFFEIFLELVLEKCPTSDNMKKYAKT